MQNFMVKRMALIAEQYKQVLLSHVRDEKGLHVSLPKVSQHSRFWSNCLAPGYFSYFQISN